MTTDLTKCDDRIAELLEAGFDAAAARLERQQALARRLAIAYEHYRYASQEAIEEFNQQLYAATKRAPRGPAEADRAYRARYGDAAMGFWSATVTGTAGLGPWLGSVTEIADQLTFVNIEKYEAVPPSDVLGKVAAAKKEGVFDAFEVASINPVATAIRDPDPIVFGRIDGCADRFFIAEWGDDVSFDQIVGANGG